MQQQRISVLIMFLTLALFCNAQGVGERAKNSADNKVNNRIDNKVDEGLEKGLDAIEGLFGKKKKKKKPTYTESQESQVQERPTEQEASSKPVDAETRSEEEYEMPVDLSAMFGTATYEDNYTFDVVSEATMTSTKKNGKTETAPLNMFHGANVWGIETRSDKKEAATAFMIYDLKNESFVILSEEKGEKQGVAMSTKGGMMEKSKDGTIDLAIYSQDGFSIKKTGKSKSIAGYRCDEYFVQTDEGSGSYWVSEEVDFDFDNMYGVIGSDNLPADYPRGYMMEWDYTNKNGEKEHYLVHRLDTNAGLVKSTKAYNVMNMQEMMQQGR